MQKSEISDEIITKMKIKLDTLFYMPEETIKGTINLYPGFKLQVKNNILHLKLKILQYEFWEYTNIKIDELKNIYKTEISTNNIEYELKKEEQSNFSDNKKCNLSNSIIIIENEDKDKVITIPFEYKINNNILPTFQFETDKYILGIRHLFIVECEEYNSVNYIGLFIGKQKSNILSEPKTINNKQETLFDEIDMNICFEKQSYYFGEDVKFRIINNAKYTFDSGSISFRQILYRKIQWIGYIKNTLLDKKVYINQIKKKYIKTNDSSEGLWDFFTLPLAYAFIGEGVGGVCGTIIGGIICPNILLGMFLGGVLSWIIGGFGGCISGLIVSLYSPGHTNFINDFVSNTNKNNDKESKEGEKANKGEEIKEENKNNDEKLKEELQKFVYFQNNKIIGFIKFKENITPPVNGYYFKCDFNLKLEIEIDCFLTNKKKILKNKIDFYDGEEYIEKMKKLLTTNYII